MGFFGGDEHNTVSTTKSPRPRARNRTAHHRSGVTPRDAELRQPPRLGNVGLLREGIREMWGWTSLERPGGDIDAARSLRNNPLFAHHGVLSLDARLSARTHPLQRNQHDSLAALYQAWNAPAELFSLNTKMGRPRQTPSLTLLPNYRRFFARNSVLTGLAGIGF